MSPHSQCRNYPWIALFLFFLTTGFAYGAERNVVLFVTDDQGMHAGCYGTPNIHTPNMDQLAEEGTRYTNAYATTASCSASRSVILSGLHNHATGQYGHTHSYNHFRGFSAIRGLPVLLGRTGYRTGRIGKYHVSPRDSYRFDRVFSAPGGRRNAVSMADNVKSFIGADSEEPFFLLFATNDPHRSGGWTDRNGQRANRFGNKPGGYQGIDPVTYDPENVEVPPFLPDTPTSRAELAEYYQSVSRIDQGLGQLIKHLKAEGVYEDTMIIYTSDHGMAFPGGKTTAFEGGLNVPFLVRNPYQSNRGVVSDAMVSFVDITPTILDYAGVLTEHDGRAGVPEELAQKNGRLGADGGGNEPYTFHGESFLPTLDGEYEEEKWNTIYASHTFHEITMYYPMRVVRDGRWKLIWNIAHDLPYPFATDLWAAPTWQKQYEKGMDASYGPWTVKKYIHRPEFQLFDLKNDPHEANNLAGKEKHADRLSELKQKIRKFQNRTDDPWKIKWRDK